VRIAFHTPLNASDDGRISGDRRMARQIATALERLGHVVEPIADARAYMTTPSPDLLQRVRAAAAGRFEALQEHWRRAGAAPELWFTYHSYYKAPDLLGPAITARLGIPYIVAEASDSPRRAAGEWASHVALARASFTAADLHLCFTARDRLGLENLCGDSVRFLDFPPFIATGGAAARDCGHGLPPRLVCVAMMRDGVKHDSYLALARALARLEDRPWALSVVGDGPRRDDVARAFAGFAPGRITWHGALSHGEVAAELACHDIFVWPGIGEAYGLVYLEAQAAGLPVVAFASGGVPATVKAGETALLAREGDEDALAAALARLIGDPALRRSMGEAARRFVASERTIDQACVTLAAGLEQAIAASRQRQSHGP
jgi:glycosyltransferase involved in cell wall biosynthesis